MDTVFFFFEKKAKLFPTFLTNLSELQSHTRYFYRAGNYFYPSAFKLLDYNEIPFASCGGK